MYCMYVCMSIYICKPNGGQFIDFICPDLVYLGLVPHQFGKMAVDFAITEEIKKMLQVSARVSALSCYPS